MSADAIRLRRGDALLVVDIQVDFVSGTLAVPGAEAVIPVLNRYIATFVAQGLPVLATRDWHPADHCSFRERGGPWPPHCVVDTPGGAFDPRLTLPAGTIVVSKATDRGREAYSAFAGTELGTHLATLGTERVFVGGLATDYCVRETIRDALRLGYRACFLVDAIRAVDVQPGDGARALAEMLGAGAAPVELADIATAPTRSGPPAPDR
jgi:nicotinamidase/pyrazinamidase